MKSVIAMKNTIGMSLILLSLGGCASWSDDYGCPGMPKGVMCKGTKDVYDLTNNRDSLSTIEDDAKSKKKGDEPPKPMMFPSGGLMAPLGGPLPVLEPAEVARIWISPWRDLKKDLHWPSYIFTEVTPRKWSFGEDAAIRSPIIVPLQVERTPTTDASAKADSKSTNLP